MDVITYTCGESVGEDNLFRSVDAYSSVNWIGISAGERPRAVHLN